MADKEVQAEGHPLSVKRVCVDRILPESWTEAARKWAEYENPENVASFGDADPSRMAVITGKKWANGRTLRCKFIGGDPQVRQKIISWATKWSQYANIKFEFVADDADSEIRIAFDANDGSWSYIGTDCLVVPKSEPTMNFGWLTRQSTDQDYSSVVMHEFGHALGCIHEHQSPAGGIPWAKDVVYRDLGGPPNNWDRETIDSNMFETYSSTTTQFTEMDPKSIMMYSFPSSWTGGKMATSWNTLPSDADKAFMLSMYPKPAEPAPAPTPTPAPPPAPGPTPTPTPPPPPDAPVSRITVDGKVVQDRIDGGKQRTFLLRISRIGRYLIGTGGNQDLALELYNASGQRIAVDDNSGAGANPRVTISLVPGEYTAVIRSVRKAGDGTYLIAARSAGR